MKKDRVYLGLLAIVLLIAGMSFLQHQFASPDLTYQVQRGDTLHKIARQYGVTVDTLRAVNGINGDVIEIDQVLIIPSESRVKAVQPPKSGRNKRATIGTKTSPPGLSMPTAKACLKAPDESNLGEMGMAASTGLSAEEIKAAMSKQIALTTDCVTTLPDGHLQLNITVDCSGLVSEVGVATNPGWELELVECITGVLRYTEFPAHALPDGDSFSYPLSFDG